MRTNRIYRKKSNKKRGTARKRGGTKEKPSKSRRVKSSKRIKTPLTKIEIAKNNAQLIIEKVDKFLDHCKIFKEYYKEHDSSVTIYLFIYGENGEKIYFYYTTFLIIDDSICIQSRRSKSLDDQKVLFIKTTHCILNGFGFSVIIQSYIMAKYLLKDILYATKEDTTDASSKSSVKNINHILDFWNCDFLELVFDETPMDVDDKMDVDNYGYVIERDLKLHATDSTKYADMVESINKLVQILTNYLKQKSDKFLQLEKKELVKIISENEKLSESSVWVFSGPQTGAEPIDEEVIFNDLE